MHDDARSEKPPFDVEPDLIQQAAAPPGTRAFSVLIESEPKL
ncbi:hypothetical protein [Bradyrhizobium nitroreducens]|nr:hypothetical protein [Bradyrhizobium nitroreducens]